MKPYSGINYQFRPLSYWDDSGLLEAMLKGITGTERRTLITQAWNAGRLDRLPKEFLESSLDEATRDMLGKIHPAYMGGEYLPQLDDKDAEIARIELRSTTRDVISVRARQSGARIHYDIVDEYSTRFHFAPRSTRRPFSLRQLIRFLDEASESRLWCGLPLAYNEMNAEGRCRRDLLDFTSITSEFYTDLTRHYERVFEDWATEQELEEERQMRLELEDVDDFIERDRCFYCRRSQTRCRHLLAVLDRRTGAFRKGSLDDLFTEIATASATAIVNYTVDDFWRDLKCSAAYHYVREIEESEEAEEQFDLEYFWGNHGNARRDIREQMKSCTE